MGTYQVWATTALSAAAVLDIVLGTTVIRSGRTARHRWFFAVALSSAAWMLTNVLFVIVDAQLREAAALASYGAAVVLVMCFLRLCHAITGQSMPRVAGAVQVTAGLIIGIGSMVPGLLLLGVDDELRLQTWLPALLVYAGFLVANVIAGVAVLLGHYRQTSLHRRERLRVVLWGLVSASLIGLVCNLLLPLFGDYSWVQVGPIGVVLFILSVEYAVVRHGLFDIRLAVVRTEAYILSLVILALLYIGVVYLLSTFLFGDAVSDLARHPLSAAIVLIVALAFQPIRDFFNYATDWLFYRQEYNRNAFFLELGNLLSHNANLQLLLRRVAVFLQKVFKAEQVFFAVHSEGAFRFFGAKGHGRLPLPDALGIYQACDQRTGQSKVVIADAVEDAALYEILRVHRIALVLPLVLRERVIGYLLLGEHRGRGYTMRDIQLLESAAGELTVALNNALSLEEVQQLNHSLRQRIDDATRELRESNRQLQRLDEAKNEFISMASHQLRTPLTSIKGYLDMVLEGDLGKINATQKTVLTEAFSSSERMVQLINDFLNVSRLQTGKFSIDRQPSSLEALVREEVTLLQVVARQRQITLKTAISRQLPPLAIDADKFRQVILNMIDNAIYYSPNHSTVSVQLRREGDEAVFIVRDKGIGVPKEEQAGLFGKFFRASNARKRRPDGTGVGLFLARKVVLAHDGQIIFESTEGKGSVFGFRLPLDQRNTPRKTRGARV